MLKSTVLHVEPVMLGFRLVEGARNITPCNRLRDLCSLNSCGKLILLAWFSLLGSGAVAEDYKHIFDVRAIDSKYMPILGSKDGTSATVFYCFPRFEPVKLGGCDMSSNKDPRLITVRYYYGLNRDLSDASIFLEAAPRLSVPIKRPLSLQSKTPYYKLYEKYFKSSYGGRPRKLHSNYGEYTRYKLDKLYFNIYVSKSATGYSTGLGNPEVIVCNGYCSISRDLGNGWLVRAQFLSEGMVYADDISLAFDNSIKEMMD